MRVEKKKEAKQGLGQQRKQRQSRREGNGKGRR